MAAESSAAPGGVPLLVRAGNFLFRYRNYAFPLILLPLLSSAFIPVDSMPGWFQPIAEYQPFTPAIETLRGLLLGSVSHKVAHLAPCTCVTVR